MNYKNIVPLVLLAALTACSSIRSQQELRSDAIVECAGKEVRSEEKYQIEWDQDRRDRCITFAMHMLHQQDEANAEENRQIVNAITAGLAGGAAAAQSSQSQAAQPMQATGMLTSQQVSGLNRICYYNVVGSTKAVNVCSACICPLSMQFPL